MAFKVVNNNVIDNDSDGFLENLSIDGTSVLVGDDLGNVTLQNITTIDSGITTDLLTEGVTNLYFTDARVVAAVNTAGFITADSTDTLTNKSGNISQWTNDVGYITTETDSQTLTFTDPNLSISNGNSVDLSPLVADKLDLSGGTLTGDLTLAGAPTNANHATTKSYVDGAISSGTGALDTDAIPEGLSNLYYTTTRANTDFDTRLAIKTTDDLTEGTNLYYTDARADARATLRITAADIGNLNNVSGTAPSNGDFLLYDSGASEFAPVSFATEVNTYADARIGVASIQDLSDVDGVDTPANGDTLVYDGSDFGFVNFNSETNSLFDIRFATKSTTDLAEGTNLYYTDARVDARLSSGSLGSLTTTGNIDVGGNIQVDGDLTVLGTTTTVLSESTRINENVLYLNEGGDATITNAVGNGSTVTYTADNSYSTGYTVDITGVNPSSFNVTDATVTAADGTSFTINSTVTDTYVSDGTAEGHAHVNVDLGWAGAYDDGTYHHAGLFRDATDGLFKVFDSYVPEPSASPDINTGHATFSLADFQAENVHLNSAPTLSNHATTKAYVDSAVSSGTGALDTDDIPEGVSNLYYTDARADARADIRIAAADTDDLNEGLTNLYYTSARANTDFDTRLATKDTGDLAEGTNLYYTTARANTDFDTRLATKSTTNLTEGTNLYYTNARADARIVAAGSANWNTAYGWGDHSTQGYLTSATNNYVDSLSFNTGDGVLTAGRSGLGNLTVDIDGRYALSSSFSTTSDVQFDSLGIGTPASGVTGEIRATNDITAFYSSDINLKENIVNIENALDKVKQIRGVEFDWTQEYIDTRGGEDDYFLRKRDTGVIAQEVEEVLPAVVATRPDGTKAVKYDRMVGLLIEAIKEQQEQIDDLKSQIENLKK